MSFLCKTEAFFKVPILAFLDIYFFKWLCSKRNLLQTTIENMYLNHRKQIRKPQMEFSITDMFSFIESQYVFRTWMKYGDSIVYTTSVDEATQD